MRTGNHGARRGTRVGAGPVGEPYDRGLAVAKIIVLYHCANRHTDDGAVHRDRDATPAVGMPGLLGARRDRPARPASEGRELSGRKKPPGTRQEQAFARQGRRLDGRVTCPARPSRRVQHLGRTPQTEGLIPPART